MTYKWRNFKKLGRKHHFMMFEILLALVVVMFGIFGISSMMPVGMSSQKQAVGTSYMTDAAEQLLRFNASKLRTDWDWLNVFASAKPDQNDQGTTWLSSSLFEVNNLRIKADDGFNAAIDNNSGLFLLEQLTLGQVDHAAIARLWKDVTVNANGSMDVTIYAEVSWPAEKPYYARDKQVFNLQVSKAPEIAMASETYSSSVCSITKENGGGYSTIISDVVDNGDSTYTIDLAITHDGCAGAECPELSSFSVEAGVGTYSNVSFGGITGTLDMGPDLDDDDFQGFKVDYTSGMGNGTPGNLYISYTLTSLQEQEMVAHGNGNVYSVTFAIADFEYVLNCNASSVSVSAAAADDAYIVDTSTGGGSSGAMTYNGGGATAAAMTFSPSDDYETLTVVAPGVLANDTTSDGSQLTAVLVAKPSKGTLTLNEDGSFTYVPSTKFKGKDGFTYKAFNGSKLTNVARVKINSTDDDIDFDIVDGEVIPDEEYTADLKMLGAAITWGGSYDMPVTVKATIGSNTIEPWGSYDLPVDGNVNVHTSMDYTLPDTYPADTPVSILGRSWHKVDSSYSGTSNSHWQQEMVVDSATGSANVLVLRNGDAVPAIEPFQNQSSIVSFLQGYIDDATDTVVLDANQSILLFELGTTDLSSSAADFQDLVVLVTLKRVISEN